MHITFIIVAGGLHGSSFDAKYYYGGNAGNGNLVSVEIYDPLFNNLQLGNCKRNHNLKSFHNLRLISDISKIQLFF